MVQILVGISWLLVFDSHDLENSDFLSADIPMVNLRAAPVQSDGCRVSAPDLTAQILSSARFSCA
jgi:hypothetical protein